MIKKFLSDLKCALNIHDYGPVTRGHYRKVNNHIIYDQYRVCNRCGHVKKIRR